MHPISWIIVQQRGALIFIGKNHTRNQAGRVPEYLRAFASKKDLGKVYGVGETAIARWLRFWRHLAYFLRAEKVSASLSTRWLNGSTPSGGKNDDYRHPVGRNSMLINQEFFEIQLHFAAYVASAKGIPLSNAIMDYTNIYIRLGLGRDFDTDNPDWMKYVSGLQTDTIRNAEHTLTVWQSRPEILPPDIVANSGCFSYAYEPGNTVRIHFENRQNESESPLDDSQYQIRHEELRKLFRLVRDTHPEAENVCGLSWLYNINAYRRLFPPQYISSSKPVTDRYRNMPLWGQFLNRHGKLRTEQVALFYEKLNHCPPVSELSSCFPLLPLAVKFHISAFYRFYGIPC
ncbi:hypothetical protein [Dickeya sp. Secpp 1600]|nr:hypothetical protein [Dickeya sp. Secpp 1600]